MASQGSKQRMDISTEDDTSTGSNHQIFSGDHYASRYNFLYVSLTSEAIKEKLFQFADNAAEELYRKALSSSPLWTFNDLDVEVLNKVIYRNRYATNNQRRKELVVDILQQPFNGSSEDIIPNLNQSTTMRPFSFEASRASKTVHKNSMEIVNMLMDVEQWVATFSSIVSNAYTLGKIQDDGNPDCALISMKAEFCLPTPYPTTRECYFVRRSKKMQDKMWLIVDVSLDLPYLKYHRKPSGCLIEQMDGGYSRITWVEHNELRTKNYLSDLFRKQVSSGFAFCASRWVTMLKYQIENHDLIKQQIGHAGMKSRLVRLAHRMNQICIRNMNTSVEKTWDSISKVGESGHIFATKKYLENNLQRPNHNLIKVLTTSVRLPFTVDCVYDSLRCAECRPKWDFAIHGASGKEALRFGVGDDPLDYVTVLNIKLPGMAPIKCLQTCFNDSNIMYVIWTFVTTETLNAVMEGGDPDAIDLLVSGAAVLPWNPRDEHGGTIVTVAFEALADSKGSVAKQDEDACSIITKTMALVNDVCSASSEDHGSHVLDEN